MGVIIFAENRSRNLECHVCYLSVSLPICCNYKGCIDKNAVQRIEAGKRFVTDIELVYLADVFNVSFDVLLGKTE